MYTAGAQHSSSRLSLWRPAPQEKLLLCVNVAGPGWASPEKRSHSCGHRRCWTAAASKGLLSLVCVVVVLVAMRFASYTLAFDGHVGRSRVLIHTTKVTDVLSVGCTYLGSRADMRYVRMWYIIRHTKTKIIARVHTCTRHTAHGTRADFFFGMYQLETRFARIISRMLITSGSCRFHIMMYPRYGVFISSS